MAILKKQKDITSEKTQIKKLEKTEKTDSLERTVPSDKILHNSKASAVYALAILTSIVVGIIFGAAAGYLAARWSGQPVTITGDTVQKITSSDENAIIGVVERTSPAVVSIIVSKDLPKMRGGLYDQLNFFGFPFNAQEDDTDGETESTEIGGGTGFFVREDGLIITNRHVVSDEDADYTVITKDGTEYEAEVVATDPFDDVALLKIKGKNFTALQFGAGDGIKIGQTAIAIGNALGEFSNTVSVGVVSGLGRQVDATDSYNGTVETLSNLLQTDAAINVGNSGGPLLNLSGEVIGMNTAVAEGAQSVGFAILVDVLRRDVDSYLDNGKITRPSIGVRHILLNATIAKNNNLEIDYGALLVKGDTATDLAVIPGSPADKAGLEENDIILEVDGVRVNQQNTLVSLIQKHNIGDKVRLKVWHDGDEKEVDVTLEAFE